MPANRGDIILTGGGGLIGREIARAFIAAGFRTFICGRRIDRFRGREGWPAEGPRTRFVEVELDRDDLETALKSAGWRRSGPVDVVHCAGYYRFPADPHLAWAGNVEATRAVLDFCARGDARSFQYVSTILVSGSAQGQVPEALHARPRGFRNAYEETKWVAEGLVAERGPAASRIFRPGATIGNSRDGFTTKFDGPYAAFGMIRSAHPFVIPRVLAPRFPLVNADLVADAVVASTMSPAKALEIFHVIDLDAPSLREFAETICARLAGHRRVLELPASVFQAICATPGFRTISGVEPEAAAYLWSEASYSTTNFATFAQAHGLDGRRLSRSLDVIVGFYAGARGRRLPRPSVLPSLLVSGPSALAGSVGEEHM